MAAVVDIASHMPRPDRITVKALMRQPIREPRYVVPGLISEGFTLLAAPPKIGKSWLMLAVAIAAASGSYVLGIPVGTPRPVLYLALEDGENRASNRIRALGGVPDEIPLSFTFRIAPGEVLEHIARFMEEHAGDAPLVILDTLGKVMPPALPGESDFAKEYRIGSALKRIADSSPGGAIIVVHHTKKTPTADFVEAVSGTNGLSGSADTVMVIRRPRASSNGVLSVTSRDAREGEYQVRFEEGRWSLDGATLAEAEAALDNARATDRLADTQAGVLAIVQGRPGGVRATEVAEALGIPAKQAGTYLGRLVSSGRIARLHRGLYGPIQSAGLADV